MADGEFAKPYFVTYLNTSVFACMLLPLCAKRLGHRYGFTSGRAGYRPLRSTTSDSSLLARHDEPARDSSDEYDPDADRRRAPSTHSAEADTASAPLDFNATFRLAAKFCGLWFLANLLNAASFNNTSVASSTILTSTSSVFTLLFGALARTERFSARKLAGVLASLAGVALVSLLDTRPGEAPPPGEGGSVGGAGHGDRGRFPYKTPVEIAVGDGMALLSACCYGLYATLLAQAVGAARRIDMRLFFGMIGCVAFVALWPGLPLLHLLGLEPFSLPPDGRVVGVLIANAAVSLVSDVCWAYAVLLTSPLVVTVGLSLTIPLSLVGQILVNAQYVGGLYWVGAAVIVVSFVVVNYEERQDDQASDRAAVDGSRGHDR